MVEVWNEYVLSLKEQLEQINDTLALSKSSSSDRVSVLQRATEHLRILIKRTENPSVGALYARISSVIGDLDLSLIATDKHGRCIDCNAAADRMFGRALLMEGGASSDSGFYLADKQTPCQENMPWFSSLAGQEINEAKVFFRRPEFPDGIWLEFNALAVKGDDGSVCGVIAIFIDITEQVQVESRIADVRRALEQRLVNTANVHNDLNALANKLGKQDWEAESQAPGALAPSGPSQREERHALVVDDILVNHALMTSHLSRLGFKVDSAHNGKEALDAVDRRFYDLILMDCDMPVMDGYEATTGIRKLESESGQRSKIIAMTGYDRLGDREKCLEAGMDEYISKGVDQSRLFQVIEAVMKGEQVEPEPEFAPAETRDAAKEMDFESMENWYGKERLREIIALYLKTSSLLMQCLKDAVAERDVRAAHHYAYCIKGPSASLGRMKIACLCDKVASSVLHNKWFDADFTYLSLESQFDSLRQALGKLIEPSESSQAWSAVEPGGPESIKIAQLERRLGKSTALAIADAFLEDTQDSLAKLASCLESKNDRELKEMTHRLAGCCASVMDKETQRLASALQELADKNAWPAAASLFATLSESLGSTRALLQRYLNRV